MKETLEETALRLSKDAYKKHSVKDDKLLLDEQIQRSGGFIVGFKEGMINGAKWQQERMYSEKEVKEIIKISCEEGMLIQRTINDTVKIPYSRIKDFTIKLFEQFKKK